MKYGIRVNGTGNAWPNFIGEEHPFYWDGKPGSLANASFSVFGIEGEGFNKEKIRWSLLIDAGHGAVQQIIKNENRIPEALLLTHHHLDHTLGIDWVIQSYWYKHNKQKKYPVYASALCWEHTVSAYPHLQDKVELTELIPGKTTTIKEIPGIRLTGYPVYHGPGAYGAMMLVMDFKNDTKVVFTGDCLCPLLRNKDIERVKNAVYLFVDSNNRFSYPLSNHFSLTGFIPESKSISEYWSEWRDKTTIDDLLAPHQLVSGDKEYRDYFRELKEGNPDIDKLCFTVFDFVRLIKPQKTGLVHYGGIEDEKYYGQKKLAIQNLTDWAKIQAKSEGIDSDLICPVAGDCLEIEQPAAINL